MAFKLAKCAIDHEKLHSDEMMIFKAVIHYK
ncbi:hypothetical protein D4N06_04135 [Klebsiella pneumoniae]|uniref:Uncharacterized protein n=6 Tax=Gammaproteobacteria TaxID=1236 RepID=A0A231WTJ7_KLEPN|nr:hypothetical protein EAE_03060 [Klebsiella aerogenes KCTC 2190]AHM77675.1 hypothetical protein KPNJ2_00895 [Klebsiella pneumoniae 30684/NJST258_2]AHM83267.1 hypothetical protein KPNJ1_00861 [Klebsiella pneumoniae 30660/NJST258_1]ARM25297.1 hypothetical protein B5G58_26625 [Klebsiella pneumoniae]AST72694.1 hypothetical protein CI103_04265 [Klebsiella pneumoniae subsp. pneumoniae]ATM93080.1 hypothetical protein CRN78_22145 [Klebsiella aerogenes]AVF86330.1 hypothetical protein AL473_00495 [Kl